jgi:hypothetical protein
MLLLVLVVILLFVVIFILVMRKRDPPDPDPAYTVTFLNRTNETLLLGVTGPTNITLEQTLPREGTLTMQPGQSLHFDIPSQWLCTSGQPGIVGVRFWARTGCRFNEADNKAQCETGSCGSLYNCFEVSGARLVANAGLAPTTLAELCFQCGDGVTHYDVSLVDGYNISMDITPVNGSAYKQNCAPNSPPCGCTPTTPQYDTSNCYWNVSGLCASGVHDLRSICPANFQLKRSDLGMYIPGSADSVVACFSNCGKYEYPAAPSSGCNENTDLQCKGWRTFCCQLRNTGSCTAGCDNGGVCWNGGGGVTCTGEVPLPGSSSLCSCPAYNRQQVTSYPAGQPPPRLCPSDLPCIGDDTLHSVCPKAYTWPNDPMTFISDATQFTVTFFSPDNTPITPASSIPSCSSLSEADFHVSENTALCSLSKGKYGGAKRTGNWDCNVDNSNTSGVLCTW